ncbi:hypothetical protein ABPG74_008561 [Tetrahymena malaccensis]
MSQKKESKQKKIVLIDDYFNPTREDEQGNKYSNNPENQDEEEYNQESSSDEEQYKKVSKKKKNRKASSDDDLDELDYLEVTVHKGNIGLEDGQGLAASETNDAKQGRLVAKLSSKISVEKMGSRTTASHGAMQSIKENINKSQKGSNRVKDKADRATVEQVLDPRTRVILVKLLNKKIINEINGCLSTGKEANVYHASSSNGKEYAIKIYKTSILIFKDREKYVAGEFRFRKGHCKSNPRKMIKLWAEKEIRNLKRIYQSSIPCPEPMLVKSNVLLMEFLGKDGKAAPRLKDAENIELEQYSKIYLQLLRDMRTLYQDCRLVHGDLSEYNLLYHNEKLYMIDVSQSIEHDHAHSLEFLRRDIVNVNMYFKKKNVITFSLRDIFDFITDINIVPGTEATILEELITKENRDTEQDEKIFAGMYIPRTLAEVSFKNIEANIDKNILNEGDDEEAKDIVYSKLTGLITKQKNQQSSESEDDDDEDNENDSEDETDKQIEAQKPNKFIKIVTKNEEDGGTEESKQKAQEEVSQLFKQIQNNKQKQQDDDDDSSLSSSSESDSDDSDDSDEDDDDENDSDEDGDDQKLDSEEAKKKKKGGDQLYQGLSKEERKKKVKEEKKQKRENKIPKHIKKQMTKKNKKK